MPTGARPDGDPRAGCRGEGLDGGGRRLGTLAGLLARPGDDPLSHPFWGSTLGAARFHGRVRNGVGWGPRAVITRSSQESKDQRSEVRDQTPSGRPNRSWLLQS